MRRMLIGFAACLTLSPAFAGEADPGLDEARSFFERFQTLGQAYDAAVVDLYDDAAVFIIDREYPSGETKTVTVLAEKMKPLIRETLPAAKQQGDWSEYTNTSFEREGERVRIRSTRKSMLRGYSGPHSLLLGRGADGQWRVVEEHLYSRPR